MGSRNLMRVIQLISVVRNSALVSPEWDRAVEEIVGMAMKADTLELLEDNGTVPESLRYPRHSLEGDPEEHGR